MLDGIFSFVLLDDSVTPSRIIAARDPIGITTLYQGWHSSRPEVVYFASELKALAGDCDEIISFPPGHVYDSATRTTERYYNPAWWDPAHVPAPTAKADLTKLREALEASVRKRLMSEVPYGVLLSGGLDSSLIASIAARETEKVAVEAARRRRPLTSESSSPVDGEVDAQTPVTWPQLHSFSIGLPNSPDLLAARTAAAFLGTQHHEYTFTVQEGLDAIPEVIYHLETYDVTTVRASTPMYLLSRKIKAMGVKMVLSGEGSDEILGGTFSSSIMHYTTDVIYTHPQGTSTSMPHRRQKPSTRRLSRACRSSTRRTVYVRTSPQWRGASKLGFPSWTKHSWILR
jgi:asparagine synthase (glutamine-hydrolysing)